MYGKWLGVIAAPPAPLLEDLPVVTIVQQEESGKDRCDCTSLGMKYLRGCLTVTRNNDLCTIHVYYWLTNLRSIN